MPMHRDIKRTREETARARLAEIETFELINELLRRGWETSTRVRNWKRPRRILLEPRGKAGRR